MGAIENNILKVKTIIAQYEKSKTLTEYLDAYEKLALYSVFIAENLSTLAEEYNLAVYARKIGVSECFMAYRKDNSEKTSQEMANLEKKELLSDEIEVENLTNRLKNFLSQINRVMDAMRTRISYEK
jgi:hypothetical protein